MTLHTEIPPPMSLPSINFLHLVVFEIHSKQDFPSSPSNLDNTGENITQAAFKGCGVKVVEEIVVMKTSMERMLTQNVVHRSCINDNCVEIWSDSATFSKNLTWKELFLMYHSMILVLGDME